MAKNIRIIIGVIFLSMISSCALPKADPCLTGQVYLNEQTQDRMEFTKKATVIITWSSDEGFKINETVLGFVHNRPYEFSYAVYDGGRKMTVLYLTSSQAACFPYEMIEISDSKDRITATRRDGRKELFIRPSRP